MKESKRAANVVKFAHSLNLQRFNEYFDSEVDDPELGDPAEQPEGSEIPEQQEKETLGTTGSETQNQAEEITQTQAFARRLKEETEKASKQAENAVYSQLYGAYGIHSKEEYDRAVAAQQEQEIREKFGEESDEILEALRFKQENGAFIEEQQAQQQIVREWEELTEQHKDITDYSQLTPEVWELSADKGISLLDAYNRIAIRDQKALIEKTKLDTEQETIKKINNNAATSAGSASSGASHHTKAVADMSREEFEAYREEVKNRRRD